jgi:multidrug efflux pump subunit AcrB
VIDTLISQNIILPGGSVNADGREVVLSPSGNFTSVDDIEETLISVPGTNSMVRLSDLLSIERGYIDPPQTLAYYDGQPAIVISVSITPGVNSVEFGERLTRKVRELEGELPIGYVLDFATFQPDLVVAAVDGALSSVYQTLAIVLVVVMLFLGMRSGLIVGSFVPITLLFGLVVMRQFGIELERVSIISSIVALGMLVDNAIVVVEDIRSRLERGQERLEACKESGRTLAVPLLTSSLTTILAFLPMLLVDGQTGDYVFSLPMVVIILLLGSWFMSMYVTPAMAFWFIRVKPHGRRGRGDRRGRRATQRSLRHRVLSDLSRAPGGGLGCAPVCRRLGHRAARRRRVHVQPTGARILRAQRSQPVPDLRRPARGRADHGDGPVRARLDRVAWGRGNQPGDHPQHRLRGNGGAALLPDPLAGRPGPSCGLSHRQHRDRRSGAGGGQARAATPAGELPRR